MSILQRFVQSNFCVSFAAHCHPRFFVTRATKLKKIAKELGLPEKPKRPLTAYARFFKDTYPTLTNATNKKREEIAREIAALWKQCDADRLTKYKAEFEKQQSKYREQLVAYNREITKAQSSMLNLEKLILEEREKTDREKKTRRAQLRISEKPKRPLTSFMLFSKEMREISPKKLNPSEIGAKWKALSEAERGNYVGKAIEESKRYRVEVQKWNKNKLE